MALRADRPGAQNLESLDSYIQNTLSALYPPFEATAATVLWQVISVAERLHGGDGLRCLTDFLIPAKRALQHLQQEACARYTGLIFFHEGWPLCVHEKVVVQLASLRGVRLRPGDFYLQVTSVGKQSARLVLKCLSRLGRGSEEVAVPEAMYGSVFTAEFLDRVNRDRNSVLLKNCLLTSGCAVYRTPWSNVTAPVFMPTTGSVVCRSSSRPGPEQLPSSASEAPAPAPAMASPHPQRGTLPRCCGHSSSEQPSHLPHLRRAKWESPRTLPGSSAVCPCEPPESLKEPEERLDPVDMDEKDGPQALSSHEDMSTNSRRCPSRATAGVEARRWFRKSYMEALRNPMPLGSGSKESITVEACDVQREEPRAAASLTQREPASPQGDPQEIQSQKCCPEATGKTLPRRSRSWDPSLRSSRGDVRQATPNSASAGPGGFLGGQAVDTGNSGASRPSGYSKEEEMFCEEQKQPLGRSEKCESAVGLRKQVWSEQWASNKADACRFPAALTELLCPEEEGWPSSTDLPSQVPRPPLEVNQELLQSGAVTLPGTRDRQGRAVVQVCTRGPLWSSQHVSSAELTCLLKYLHGIPRKEVQDLGLVILVDARESPAAPALSQALTALQSTSPPAIHSVLLLVDKESALRPDKDPVIQCEVVGSLKALHKLVDSSQLTAELEGSFRYSHSDWICLRRKLETFTANCQHAIGFLQTSVHSLNAHRPLSTAQEVAELIRQHKALMTRVLEDPLLVTLRLDGGTVLARLRREEHGTSEDGRDSIEAASRLYNQVDEEVHRLVLTSNRCLQELETLRELRTLQEGGDQACAARHRTKHGGTKPSTGEKDALTRREGSGCDSPSLPTSIPFASQVTRCMSCGCECLEPLGPARVTEYLKSCQHETMEGSESVPRASKVMVPQSHALRLPCQQTRLCFHEALPEAAPGPGTLPLGQSPPRHKLVPGAEAQHHEPFWTPLADPKGRAAEWAQLLPSLHGQAALCGQEGAHLGPGVLTPDNSSTSSSEPQAPVAHSRKKMMKTTQSFETSQLDGSPRDSRWPGHTGVFIKGLEVTSTVASEKPPSRPHAESPMDTRNQSLSSPSRTHPSEEDGRRPAGSSRLQHIMAEMISTEREYVRSLGYVIDNYFPEMERADLPPSLRGERGTIFGNWEQLHSFHCQHFLPELEHCRQQPLAVGRGFLRHEEQFGMYALYSENKPRSDALLCSYSHVFKDKQRALGDKMDLASYLLKPVQRMGKYALLLEDLLREAGRWPACEPELAELRAAQDVVRSQLRHGNDLLAVDAVRGCDVRVAQKSVLHSSVSELRMQQMVSMGLGSKPFLDIKASDVALSDRAVNYIMKGTGSRARASTAVPSCDHTAPSKRPHSTISDSSTSSSSSQSSALRVPGGLLSPAVSPWPHGARTCIREDELEQETGAQPQLQYSSAQ
ncbi:PREDICTED: pleckstrin homology domain-containing family G member 4B [Hipposideros armiger]|uniref:Pleckstrin homology domain-containing family G member 4B n=1 Tax=Hipposideros armiger TaxID=186990 RepID=A0A8B7PUL0_HIPAR|nr:PREDICTED: pleckstrin homology domain-containing family G member 4B [Hipposideros armiger]